MDRKKRVRDLAHVFLIKSIKISIDYRINNARTISNVDLKSLKVMNDTKQVLKAIFSVNSVK